MTIYIDPPLVEAYGRLWSHVVSDTSYDELHEFAAGVGLPERAFERDHYDVPDDYYDAMIAAGAVPVSSKDVVRILRDSGLRRRR